LSLTNGEAGERSDVQSRQRIMRPLMRKNGGENVMAIGRPKLAPHDRHSETVRIPLRPADHARLQSMADQAETTITDFVRASALGQKFTVIQSHAPDFETSQQLLALGRNFNQFMKLMHQRNIDPPADMIRIAQKLEIILDRILSDDPTHHHRPKF
jgi:SLT domain-containing protein